MVANSVQRLINKPISKMPADPPPKLVEEAGPPPPLPLRPTRPSPQPPPPTHRIPRSPPVQAVGEERKKEQMRTPPPPDYSRAAPPIPNNPPQLQRKFLTPPPPEPGTLSSVFRMSTHSLPDYGLPGREHPSKPPVVPVRKDSLRKGRHIGVDSGSNTFEGHFQSRFKHPSLFPAPDQFSNCEKTFPSNRTIHTTVSKLAPGSNKPAVSAARKPAAIETKNKGEENSSIPSPVKGSISTLSHTPLSQTVQPVPPPLPKATPRRIKTSSPTSLPIPRNVIPAPPPPPPLATAPTLLSHPSSLPSTVPVPPPLPKPESTLATKVQYSQPQQVENKNENKLKAFPTEPEENPTSHSATNITVKYQEMGVAVMEDVKEDKTSEMFTKDDSPVSVKNMVEKLSKLYSTNYQGESNFASKAVKPPIPNKQPGQVSRISGLQCQKPPALRLRSPQNATPATVSPTSPPPPAPPRTNSLDPIPHSPLSSAPPNVVTASPTVSTPVARRQSFRAAPPPPGHLHQDGAHGERKAVSSEVPDSHEMVRRKYSFRAAPPPPVMDNHVKSGNQVVVNTALSSKLQMC